MGKKRFDLFDLNLLRGIAILGVLIIHTDQMISGISRWLDMLSEAGQMGCEIFFVLSGFGLCYSWQNVKGNFFQHYRTFLKTRWFKIGLPYCITIILLLSYICVVSVTKIDSVMVQPIYASGILCILFLINGIIPVYHNYLFLGSWFMGTLAILYIIFPFVFKAVNKSSLFMLKVYLWILAGIPVLFSLIDYYCLGTGKHLINSFWYFSVINQFPCFYIGILLYFEFEVYRNEKKHSLAECIIKTFFWLFVFAFFFWLRESLLLSATIVCTAFGKAVYWIFIFCSHYLYKIRQKWKIIDCISVFLEKYGSVSYYAFLIHSFWVRDFLHWILGYLDINGNFAYCFCLVITISMVYWTAKIWRVVVEKLLRCCRI